MDLRTDYVPVSDVVQVETEMLTSSAPVQIRTFGADTHLLTGFRTGDFSGVGANEQTLEVRLLAPGLRVLAKRRVVVTVAPSGVTGVTVVITRDCLAVVCPDGADASATECLNGQCVPPTCSAERPELCGDATCNADEECGASTSPCATPRCRANACLDTPVEGACTASEVCLLAGCAPRPSTDAGAVDAGTDGPTDTGTADTGTAETGTDAGLPTADEEPDLIADLEACDSFAGVPDRWRAPDRDIELLAFGDTQYAANSAGCARPDRYRDDQNGAMIAALNGIEAAAWPPGFAFHREGLPFRMIRGVLLAGDVTENGSERDAAYAAAGTCGEYRAFREAFGLCADRDLRYPVYEGYGNHDFPFRPTLDEHHPVIGYIGRRSPHRPSITRFSPPEEEHGHYSWDWDDIHFVNLNVKPSGTAANPRLEIIDGGPGRIRRIDPHAALDFLDADLAAHLRGTRQFVLMTHYGPSNGSRFEAGELAQLCDVLTAHDARLIAWVHGHTHKSDLYTWTCNGRATTVLNVGAPFYTTADVAGRLHFAVVRIGNNWLEAVDVSVRPTSPTAYEIPGHATTNDSTGYNPDALWGGWGVRARIDPPLP